MDLGRPKNVVRTVGNGAGGFGRHGRPPRLLEKMKGNSEVLSPKLVIVKPPNGRDETGDPTEGL
jgi:hypothetical protein